MSKKRFREIDIAKGIGILLVLIGHCFPDVSTEYGVSDQCFRIIHDVIYTFHMPLMFFLAGFLTQRIFRLNNCSERLSFAKDRFIRLMVPYFFVGLLYMPVKVALSKFANQPFELKNLWLMFLGENPNGGLWYLFCLFFIQLILVFISTKKTIKAIVPISAFVSFMVVFFSVSFYRIDDAVYYLFFVASGLLVGYVYREYENKLVLVILSVCGLLLSLFVFIYLKYDIQILKVLCGVFGTGFVLSFSNLIKNLKCKIVDGLEYLGHYSMDIYILHGMVMAGVRIIIWSLLKLNYYICTVIILVCGLFLPIIISKYIIRKFNVLKFLFFGERQEKV